MSAEDEPRKVESDLSPDVYSLKLGRGLYEDVSVTDDEEVVEFRMPDSQVDGLIGYLQEMRR